MFSLYGITLGLVSSVLMIRHRFSSCTKHHVVSGFVKLVLLKIILSVTIGAGNKIWITAGH
jgi:hypothetical protein